MQFHQDYMKDVGGIKVPGFVLTDKWAQDYGSQAPDPKNRIYKIDSGSDPFNDLEAGKMTAGHHGWMQIRPAEGPYKDKLLHVPDSDKIVEALKSRGYEVSQDNNGTRFSDGTGLVDRNRINAGLDPAEAGLKDLGDYVKAVHRGRQGGFEMVEKMEPAKAAAPVQKKQNALTM